MYVETRNIMTKRKIFIGILITFLTIIVLTFIFRERLITSFVFKNISPRETRNQIEVTNNIGWWAHQQNMKIDSFSVGIIESKLNLFNSISLIKYTIKGELKENNNWKPYIRKVHISERFVRKYNRELHPYLDTDTAKIPEAVYEITPIVDVKKDNNYKGESVKFEFTNEMKIESFHWGNNWLRFQCDDFQKDLTIKQRK